MFYNIPELDCKVKLEFGQGALWPTAIIKAWGCTKKLSDMKILILTCEFRSVDVRRGS